jgi:cell division protein FtsN
MAVSRMRGGTLVGFLAGLLLGLAVAVAVAVFVTRAPVPFMNKAGRGPDRIAEPKSPAEAPDPNKPLYSKNRPALPAETAPPPAPVEEDRGSILDRLFGKGAAESAAEAARAAGQAPAKGEDRGADSRTGGGTYVLQAGAYRSAEDADGMKAKLALLGFEARVLTAEVNGQTMYRVRVGPYAQLDDMNRARSRLAENGIEAAVVRQR